MVADLIAEPGSVKDLSARQRIVRSAMEEFGSKGWKGATMRGVAQAAEVSLGLVQHHFGTKEGLREACDQAVFEMLRIKVEALSEDRLGDPHVLNTLMSMGPLVQRYVGRALIDGSPRMATMVDEVMTRTEGFLTSNWPDRFPTGSRRTRDAGAVMTAINTSIMVLQAHLARRMEFEPWTEEAVRRTGMAMFDVFEAIADWVGSDTWRTLRDGVRSYYEDEEDGP